MAVHSFPSAVQKSCVIIRQQALLESLSDKARFLAALEQIVGKAHLVTNEAALEEATTNSLGVERNVVGMASPGSVAEVQQIVRAAHTFGKSLYPISRGKNLGYGERAPAENGQLILDLSRLNRIRDFDSTHGTVVLEPGVTQLQLYEFLKSRQAPFWMDTTGAPLDSSLVGNTLEGGFGHTPRGNRRRELTKLEVILGDGTLLETSAFPGIGQ